MRFATGLLDRSKGSRWQDAGNRLGKSFVDSFASVSEGLAQAFCGRAASPRHPPHLTVQTPVDLQWRPVP